jgi:hypothetical protein
MSELETIPTLALDRATGAGGWYWPWSGANNPWPDLPDYTGLFNREQLAGLARRRGVAPELAALFLKI